MQLTWYTVQTERWVASFEGGVQGVRAWKDKSNVKLGFFEIIRQSGRMCCQSTGFSFFFFFSSYFHSIRSNGIFFIFLRGKTTASISSLSCLTVLVTTKLTRLHIRTVNILQYLILSKTLGKTSFYTCQVLSHVYKSGPT